MARTPARGGERLGDTTPSSNDIRVVGWAVRVEVIVAHAPGMLHPRVVPAIRRQGYEPTVIECENIVNSPRSYPGVLRAAFESGRDFCVIEHDVESRPGFLSALEECPTPWCFFAYDFSIKYEDAVLQPMVRSAPLGVGFAPLGHTRFRKELAPAVLPTVNSELFQASWVARDAFTTGALSAAGYLAHRHPGKAMHHHDYGLEASASRMHQPL